MEEEHNINIPKSINTKLAFGLLLISVILASGLVYVFAATPSSTYYVSPGIHPGAASFTIWRESTNYFAKNANGEIPAWAGITNITLLCEHALGDLPSYGGRLYFKAGEYVFDSTLVISRNGTELVGEGDYNDIGLLGGSTTYGTKFKFSEAVNGINVTGGGWGVNAVQGCLIEGIWIYGNGTSNGKAGIYVDYGDQLRMNRLSVSNYQWGVYLNRCEPGRIENSWLCYNGVGFHGKDVKGTKIWDCEISDNDQNGIVIYKGGTTGDYTFVDIQGCGLYHNGYTGIAITRGYGNHISGCDIFENGHYGIDMDNTFWNTINGNEIIGQNRSGIRAYNNSGRNNFGDNILRDNDKQNTATYNGIDINGNENVIIGGQYCDNDLYSIVIVGDKNNVVGAYAYGADQVAGIKDTGTNTKIHASWNGTTYISTYP